MRCKPTRALLGACALAALASGAFAQDRAALVVANTGYAGDLALPEVRRSAEDLSETLFGLGFRVTRLENAGAAQVQSALAGLAGHEGPVVIYYAGHGFAHDGASWFLPVGADVSADPAALAATAIPAADLIGPGRITILDMCHGPASQGLPGAGALDASLSAIAGADADVLLMSSVAPGQPCPAGDDGQLTDVLLERLALPGLLDDQLLPTPDPAPAAVETGEGAAVPVQPEGFFMASTRNAPFVFREPTSGTRLSQEDYALLEKVSPAARAQLLALWEDAGIIVDFEGETTAAPTSIGQVTNETVVLTDPVRPVSSATTLTAVAPVSAVSAASVARVTNDVQVLTVAPPPQTAAPRPVPGAGDLPSPSIIVGFPEQEVAAAFETVEDDDPGAGQVAVGALGGNEVSYENVTLRRDFAENNRDLYLSLVESGAFDPPQPQMARALQTELARMNCYTAGIDGVWGNGSRRSVSRYYEQIGGAAPSQDPTLDIWRQLMIRDDVRCPDVVVAQPTRRATSSSSSSTRSSSSSAPRRATPAPAPAPAPSAPARRTIGSSAGTGVFR